MNKKQMMEPFEKKGVWWLPESPRKRVYGTLTYDIIEGATLDLYGMVERDLHTWLSRDSSLPENDIIVGELPDGKPVTLFQFHHVNVGFSRSLYTDSNSSNSFPVSKLRANYVFEGEHFLTKEDIKFEKISISLSHLRNWANHVHVQQSNDENKLIVTHNLPPNVVVIIPHVGKLTLYYDTSVSQSSKNTTLGKEVGITIEAKEPTSFGVWLKTIYLLQAFLSFATRHPVHLLQMDEVKAIDLKLPRGETRKSFVTTDVFFRLSEIPEDSSTESPANMLFTLKDIADNFELCLQNWFQKAELLEPVYELHFGTLHNPTMYPIHKFSSLAQALETYHRRTNNRSAFPKEEFEIRKKEILTAVPSQYEEWLKEKLSFSNELSLRQRLEDIMQTYNSIVGIVPNQVDFIKKVVNTRNYLTHYDKRLRDKAVTGMELSSLSNSLRMLVEMCLLRELGISDEKISQIITTGNQGNLWFNHPK